MPSKSPAASVQNKMRLVFAAPIELHRFPAAARDALSLAKLPKISIH
jgi:hypothetical protein